jgi:predicted dehydrogenase
MAKRFAADIPLSETGRLVAVASRNPEKAASFAPDVTGMDSYEALAQSDSIDAIYVATPNATHKDLCLLALRNKKAVLCEKPIATRSEDLLEIIEASEQAGVICMEGLWSAFLPGFVHAKQCIDQGQIGTPVAAQMSLGFPRMEKQGDPITDPALGGGAVMDLGVYCVALLNQLLGKSEVIAHRTTRSDSGSIRTSTALLQHTRADGGTVQSTVTTSHDSFLPNQLNVSGTGGRIAIFDPVIQVAAGKSWSFELQPYTASTPPSNAVTSLKKTKIWPKIRRLAKSVSGDGGSPLNCDYLGTGFQYQIDEIGRAFCANIVQSTTMPLKDSLNNLKILEKMESSGL